MSYATIEQFGKWFDNIAAAEAKAKGLRELADHAVELAQEAEAAARKAAALAAKAKAAVEIVEKEEKYVDQLRASCPGELSAEDKAKIQAAVAGAK